MTRTPPRQGYFVYPPLSGKPQTDVKRPLHTDRASPKKLFAPKEIRTLDLMGLPQRPKPFSKTLFKTQYKNKLFKNFTKYTPTFHLSTKMSLIRTNDQTEHSLLGRKQRRINPPSDYKVYVHNQGQSAESMYWDI